MIDEYTFDNKEMLKQKIKGVFAKKGHEMVMFQKKIASFEIARNMCEGYEADQIFNKIKKAALEVKNGKACYERDGYLFYERDYYLQLIAILLGIYLERGKLQVIDYGGSLGSTYFQNRDKLVPYVDELNWNIVEQKHFVEWGRKNLEDDFLKFFYSINEIDVCNCVLFGSSLQYLENYREILSELSNRGVEYIIVDRVPVSNESWISLEYVHEPIYEAVYPALIFEECGLTGLMEKLGYVLEMKWVKDVGESWQLGNKLIKEKSFFFFKRK